MSLTAEQGRVLGALVEKELTTPQGYPLTDNALLAACNQTTSRDPIVSYDLATLRTAVRELRAQDLLRTVHRPGERSEKHRHELPAALGLSPEQLAVLTVLLLRGPQTAAELRARSERMHPFGSTEAVEDVLVELGNREPPLATRLERQPGRKEARWAQLLTEAATSTPAAPPAISSHEVARAALAALNAATATRNVEAALACFTPDAVLLGSGATENAVGQDELRAFLTRFFARAHTVAWEGSDLTVGDAGDVVWFLLVGEAVTGERFPYRLSAVLVPYDGQHRIAQLHGSEPVAD